MFCSYMKLTNEEKERVAHQPKDFVVSCSFGLQINPDCEKFIQTGGTKIFSPKTGVCYALNLKALSPDKMSQLMARGVGGSFTSVTVELNIEGYSKPYSKSLMS